MPGAGRQGEDRVLTVPNALSALRLACLPAFVVLLAQPHDRGRLAAAFLLGAAAFTDLLDGYIARHFDQVSTLGKMADPLVDRALVLCALVGATVIGALPIWLVVVVALREGVVLAGSGLLFFFSRTDAHRRQPGGQGRSARHDDGVAAVHHGPRPVPLPRGGARRGLGNRGRGPLWPGPPSSSTCPARAAWAEGRRGSARARGHEPVGAGVTVKGSR